MATCARACCQIGGAPDAQAEGIVEAGMGEEELSSNADGAGVEVVSAQNVAVIDRVVQAGSGLGKAVSARLVSAGARFESRRPASHSIQHELGS